MTNEVVENTCESSFGEAQLLIAKMEFSVRTRVELYRLPSSDQRECYDTLNKHGAKVAIPPRKGAKISRHANSKAERHIIRNNGYLTMPPYVA